MKKGLALLLLLLVTSRGLQAHESSWLTDYGDALNVARTSSRPLLLVISRGDRLPTSDLLRDYVLCKIDANSGYGKRVAEAFRVTQFPHSVIIDKTTNKILFSRAGEATEEAWRATLSKYRGGAAFESSAAAQPQTLVRTQPQTPSRTQPQTSVRTQPQTTYRTQTQTSNWSQPRSSGRAFYFRQPAVCNT